METQKIGNLLNDSDNKSSKFASRKWYIINDQNNGHYGKGNENDSTIKFEKKVIKQSLCDYSDAYILATGDIKVLAVAADTNVAFKNCALFTRCVTHINDEHVETAENLDIIMPMYHLIEYSDNYADSSESLYQFKRDESPANDARNPLNVALDNSISFKYKVSLLGKATDADGNYRSLKIAKIVAPLKYLSNFFRSLEMPLINCKIHLELNWNNNCVMYGADTYAGGDNANNRETTFKMTSTKLYVPIVTLATRDNVNLTKQLNEGFKRSVNWNEFKLKIETKVAINNNVTRFPLDVSFQGVNRLFVLAFGDTNDGDDRVQRNSHRKYFLPRIDITNYNVLIDSRNFYDQPISDQIRKYDEIRKITIGKGDDYTTGCWLDYHYFKDHYQLIAVDLSKQKELDADPRVIQQIEFYGMLKTNSQVYIVLEKSKETVLEFYKGTAKVLEEHING